tara:strand:+ start:320 stop:622 length:303 start_codon:yes stop_codon:yes gene_type:complete
MIDEDTLLQLDKLTNSKIYDSQDGDYVYQTVETRDTLDDFKTNSGQWAECGKPFKGLLGEFSYIGWSSVQARRGDMRDPITIIDLGSARISMRHDIRDLI